MQPAPKVDRYVCGVVPKICRRSAGLTIVQIAPSGRSPDAPADGVGVDPADGDADGTEEGDADGDVDGEALADGCEVSIPPPVGPFDGLGPATNVPAPATAEPQPVAAAITSAAAARSFRRWVTTGPFRSRP